MLDGDSCLTGACQPNATAASELTGLPLRLGSDAIALTTQFAPAAAHNSSTTPSLGPPIAGSTYGASLGVVSPWLYCDETEQQPAEASQSTAMGGIAVLGRYVQQGKASIAWRQVTAGGTGSASFNSVFIGAPRPPTAFWRSIAQAAGVPLFTTEPLYPIHPPPEGTNGQPGAEDSVEVGGSGLLYHAGDSVADSAGTPLSRVVRLPVAARVESEWGEVVCEDACTEFRTPPLRVGESILYWLGSD